METRIDRQNDPNRRHFSFTLLGKRATKELFLEPLAAHIAANLDPPGGLAEALRKVPAIELAQAALVPMLHGAMTDWQTVRPGDSRIDDDVDRHGSRRELCFTVGQYLHCLLAHKQLLKEGRPDLARGLQRPPVARCDCPACLAPRKGGRKKQADVRDLWLDSWDPTDFVAAGWWLVGKALAMPYFTIDKTRRSVDGKTLPFMPVITPEWMERVEAIRQDLIRLDYLRGPSYEPIPDWASLFQDGLCFVAGFHAETRAALKRAFADRQIEYDADDTEVALARIATANPDKPPTPMAIAAMAALQQHVSTAAPREIPGLFVREHVAGVNTLQGVKFTLDPIMVELAERFAWKIISPKLKKRHHKQRRAVVRQDLAFARSIIDDGRPFRMRHYCDWRGRVYQMPQIHYQREDFIRAMFRFADGKKLTRSRAGARTSYYENGTEIYNDNVGGYADLEILEIHCANCYGQDKLPWDGRLIWIKESRELIERVAADPVKTFDEWREVDSPFCFVAACRELVRAWSNPNYESCLPVAFDGSANGYQHAALLVGNAETAGKVNLIGTERNDLYSDIVDELMKILSADGPEDCLRFFEQLDHSQRRKFAKPPTMTFGYGAEEGGMVQDIVAVFYDLFPNAGKQRPRFFLDLVKKILDAIDNVLPGAFVCRNYITDLSSCRMKWGGFLEWTSPTGFPVINSYRESKVDDVYGHYGFGGRIKVANGEKADKPRIDVAIRSAAPNFVHSLDASHLIRTVFAAKESGIENLVTVHDSFACLAADAPDLLRIIKRELFLLYYQDNWLERLCERNIPGGDMPRMGDLNNEEILNAEYPWS
jgi:DNA-dependent RNA polymerase